MGLGRKKGPGGGGGVGAVLTVTAPAGVTVSVSKDGKTKTKTANADGLAVFKGLATGTWTLTITDGVQTSTKPVSVTADYSTVIAFFSATINITYPSGSTCTCSDGTTTFNAPDTSGTWKCVVSNKGTWTVSCTNGTESTSETVEITADGQSAAIELSYLGYAVRNGIAIKDLAVLNATWSSSSGDTGNDATITQKNGYVSVKGAHEGYCAAYVKMSTTQATRLVVEGNFVTGEGSTLLAVWSKIGPYVSSNMVASVWLTSTGASLDVSGLTGPMYVGITSAYTHEQKIVNLYLE